MFVLDDSRAVVLLQFSSAAFLRALRVFSVSFAIAFVRINTSVTTSNTLQQRRIPMLDLRRQYEQIGAELQKAVAEVLASQAYVLGPAVKNFELEAAAELQVKHAIGCASGTDALWLALAAVEIKAGDAVVTTPFSFFATASCITRVGAT